MENVNEAAVAAQAENVITGVATETAKKKRRGRGVSNQTQLQHLKFHEKDAAKNGLFIGHLDSVTVDYSTPSNESNSSFAGISLPRLVLHFKSNHLKAQEQRYIAQTLFPVESNVDTIPGGKSEWQVNNILNWIKHLLETFYLNGRDMTVTEEDALTLPFVDFDEDDNGNVIGYSPVDPEEVAKGYGFIFENCAAMLNGTFGETPTGKPCYKDANGRPISIWMKLLRATKSRNKGWKNVTSTGDLGFPLVGQGVIEVLKKDEPAKVLRLDMAKESITPKETDKAPNLGVAGVPMAGAVVVGGGAAMPVGGGSEAFDAAAGDEMPF